MAYEQAQIAIQKAEEFEQLRSALERIFASGALERFYKQLENRNVGAREFEKIVDLGILEKVDSALTGKGRAANQIYRSLPVSDQALMREFYLERVEKVAPELRLKYQNVYRYY